mmetsp:Transcript_1865/g.4004  ORF Transcript_1865/g.4004 Transcript_1865/m.4004 type:complete len:205 (-) Transcript_1865:2316-2930(-)
MLVKLQHLGLLKRVSIDPVNWQTLLSTAQASFRLNSAHHVMLITTIPGMGAVMISCQKELELLLAELARLKVTKLVFEVKVQEQSFFSQILVELLSLNTDFVKRKIVQALNDYPGSSFSSLVNAQNEPALVEKFRTIFESAKEMAQFKLVYVEDGGGLVLKSVPHHEFIDYSTTDLADLAHSLPPERLHDIRASISEAHHISMI